MQPTSPMSDSPDAEARFLAELSAHQGALRRVARAYARDAHEREDLFQEILLAAWSARGRFRGAAALSTFLFRVALNTALMRRRQDARRPGEFPALEPAAPAAPEEDPRVERLYAAVRRLAPLDRALVLLVLEQKSHAEIAEVTGLTVGNVGVRLSRSRESLRQLLEPDAPGRKGTPCSTTD